MLAIICNFHALSLITANQFYTKYGTLPINIKGNILFINIEEKINSIHISEIILDVTSYYNCSFVIDLFLSTQKENSINNNNRSLYLIDNLIFNKSDPKDIIKKNSKEFEEKIIKICNSLKIDILYVTLSTIKKTLTNKKQNTPISIQGYSDLAFINNIKIPLILLCPSDISLFLKIIKKFEKTITYHPKVDLIIKTKIIICHSEKILTNHSIIINKKRIHSILPEKKIKDKYLTKDEINLKESILIPGMINMHTHMGMTLMEEIGGDKKLQDWLENYIWPAEKKFVSESFVHISSILGIHKSIKNGVTTFNDMYFYPEITAKDVLNAGVRAALSIAAFDFPFMYAKTFDEFILKKLYLINKYTNNEYIKIYLSPHSPYTVSKENYVKIMNLCKLWKINLHTHLHETKNEVINYQKNNKYSPIKLMDKLNILNNKVIAAHAVYLDDEEIYILSKNKVNVVCCPSSNKNTMIDNCPVNKYIKKEVNLSIGTDSIVSSNTLSILHEMNEIYNFSKLEPAIIFKMATINGAKALNLENEIGTISIGKQADIVAIDLKKVEYFRVDDIFNYIVSNFNNDCISDVWVAGKRILKDRKVMTVDIEEIKDEISMWKSKISSFFNDRC